MEKFYVMIEKQLHEKEIDIYLPELRLGFEFNGDYWHMNPLLHENNEINPSTHFTARETWEHDYKKQILAKQYNILLYVVWEYDWIYNNEKTKKDILNIINNSISQ